MLRFLSIAAAVLVLTQPVAAAPPAADGTTDKNAAITALMDQASSYVSFASEIDAALANKDNYLFGDPFNDWVGLVVITRDQVETFVRYLQVEYMLHPGELDAAIQKSAKALKIRKEIVDLMLQDRAAVLASGGAEVAHKKLREVSDKNREWLAGAVKQLDDESEALILEAQKIAGISSWPPTGESENVFSPVEVGGVTVDYCLSFAVDCGQPVADEFCKRQGFQKATSFEWQYMHPTQTLRSGESCDFDGCGGFTSITCE